MRNLTLITLALLSGTFPIVAQTLRLAAEREKNFGVAYLEQEKPREATEVFRQVIALVPDEALGYANLGLAYLRMSQADSAAFWLDAALQQNPQNAEILLLMGELHYWRGAWLEARRVARQALNVRPRDRLIRYLLYRTGMAQPGDSEGRAIAAEEISQLFEMVPDNLVVAAKYTQLAAEQADLEKATRGLAGIGPMVVDMEIASGVLKEAQQALADGDAAKVRQWATILENVLRPSGRYKQDLTEVRNPILGLPLTRFSPAFYEGLVQERPPEIAVSWVPLENLPALDLVDLRPVILGSLDYEDMDGDGLGDLLVALSDGTREAIALWRKTPAGWKSSFGFEVPAVEARFVDFDDDGVFDVAAAGAQGLRLFGRDTTGIWRDVSAGAGISQISSTAIEVVDADNEGDLDFCVGTENGVRIWQNRLDGTFREAGELSGLSGLPGPIVQVLALDHDDDGDPDLLVVDAEARLRLFDNLRHGRFGAAERGLDSELYRYAAASDLNNDGWLDLALIQMDGSLVVQQNTTRGFAPPVQVDGVAQVNQVLPFDFDNDGWQDLAIAGKSMLSVLRNRGDGRWTVQDLGASAEAYVALVSGDVEGDGDLDLLGLDGGGEVVGWRNEGGNANGWLRVRLKGLRTGGTRNNLQGIGSKVEIKVGLHYQMHFVRSSVTHLGLGSRQEADLLRVTWSNGVPQNVFRPAANQVLVEKQVLKGSCPFLYCWNGERFDFVTDLLGGAPLGLQVAEGVIAPDNPRELMTIPGNRIAAKDDEFVFQFTEELWETVYLDEVALWAVDHPSGIEVWTDQRILPPPYEPVSPILSEGRYPPIRAVDTAGKVVTDRLLKFDYRYPERLETTRYQGIVSPHTLTLSFGDVSALDHPLLVIGCWIFWTDTSINVSMSQGNRINPQLPVVDVWHPASGWRPLDDPFGLPKGKDKWAVLDLADDLYLPDAQIRIRTSYQIYWDQVFLANAVPKASHRITRLAPRSADLHYGGFSRMHRPAADGPHLYDYVQRVSMPLWQDMEGLATRYGDVTELLETTDDRYIIMIGGDEVTVRFDAEALPPQVPGWKRDFLFLSDGWDKDADKNTVTGNRVGPLPFHGMSSYPYPAIEAYPKDDAHRAYREIYNTRRVGSEAFRLYVKDYGGGEVPQLPWIFPMVEE